MLDVAFGEDRAGLDEIEWPLRRHARAETPRRVTRAGPVSPGIHVFFATAAGALALCAIRPVPVIVKQMGRARECVIGE